MSSLRFPSSRGSFGTGETVLRHELLEEQAAALGRLGGKARAALSALAVADDAHRASALKTASDAVWCFFVQREVLGLRDRAAVISEFEIPREVLNRLGVT